MTQSGLVQSRPHPLAMMLWKLRVPGHINEQVATLDILHMKSIKDFWILKPENLHPKLSTAIVSSIVVLFALMAFHMPSFVSRFMRPFTSSTSISLQPDALAARSFPENTQRATIAAGCFWGVEHLYRKKFGHGKGLLDARVGYTGGGSDAPNYRTVCSGKTGHAESLLVAFDPDKVSYRQLLEFFWKMHDPTTKDQQGGDRGTQYRSAVFANSEEQLKIAEELKEKVAKEWYPDKPITTEVTMAGPWFDAEDYHQLYLEKTPHGYECPMHFERNFKPLSS